MYSAHLQGKLVGLGLVFSLMLACSVFSPVAPQAVPETEAPEAMAVPPPTATATEVPVVDAAVGEWVTGHFFSIKVVDVQTETQLDGERPTEDQFVVIEVMWKANDLKGKQVITGIEFQLVDDTGKFYDLAGMVFDSESFDAHGVNAQFDKGGWIESKVTGDADKTYILVFDVPASAHGLKLWFRNLTLVDLELDS